MKVTKKGKKNKIRWKLEVGRWKKKSKTKTPNSQTSHF
jgi:hypothetical protein